jgi:FtsZ-interacting cell division protein ZipA
MIDSLADILKKTLDFLGGLTLLDFIFLGLFFIIFIWMFVTHKRVKRVISDPLKKYDKDIKKKQDELDREKEAIVAFARKEITKVEKVRAEQEEQFKKKIEAMKEMKIEKEADAELKAEVKAKVMVEKEMEAEKAAWVEPLEEEVQAEKEAPIEPAAQVEKVEESVQEVQAEKEIQAEKEKEPDEKIEVSEEESKPAEEPKKAPEKPAKKEKPSKLTSEQYFILSAIADEPDKTYQEDAMHKIFKMAFSEREKEDFDQDIKKLEKLNYIVLEKPSGYRVWLKITDKGLNHYRNTERK